MLGNFLTTLGNLPEEDHAMFAEHGLNVAPQPDNGANPRPDNRSGWLEGETPDVVAEHVAAAAAPALDVTALGSLRAAALSQEVRRAAQARRGAQPRAPRGRVDRSQMLDLQDRLDELKGLGLYRRMRMVSGPQGPRVVLDGKPVLLLCSNNYLGLADHPRVREAAADAAMRWGAGAGASRLVSGNMTLHRRLEERLAAFKGTQSALLFGSGYLANLGVVPALARRGEIVFSDELNHASIIDGCRLSGAETFVYRHADVDHLAWGLRNADGRGALIVTDGVFSMDGDVAPLEEIVELARRHDVRVMVDDAHGTGTLGPGGRGAVAEAGLEGEVDVIVGTLGKALGSYGAFVACDHAMARYLVNSARPLIFSTGLPPAAAAAAMAALELLQEQPRRVERLADNADALRDELAREGFDVSGSETQIVPLIVGEADLAMRICEAALEQGVFAQAIRPPTVPEGTSRLRLAVMASHTRAELRDAARVIAQAALRNGLRPSATLPVAAAQTTAAAARASACSTATRRSACRRRREPGAARPLMRGLFVTGTDTGVGKTVVAGAIVAALRARGERVAAFKPVVTGLDEPAEPGWPRDHELLAAAAGVAAEAVAPHAFGPPVSPHLAAELAGVELDLDAIVVAASAAAAEAGASVLVAEGVGGLLVPLTAAAQRARSRRRARLPARRRRAAGARDDQPHAADARGGAGGGPDGRGRRDDAVAGAAERDGALEPRDGRPARRGRRRDAAAAARRLAARRWRPAARRCRSPSG